MFLEYKIGTGKHVFLFVNISRNMNEQFVVRRCHDVSLLLSVLDEMDELIKD
jgi:hypothetical protein